MKGNDPYLGVIEGFFGRTWTFEERTHYADFLKNNGYHFYIYAPKADPYLRKSWQQDWPTQEAENLSHLVQHYQKHGLHFGIGLSPFEIYINYDGNAQSLLQQKVEQLNALGIDILCILFDDMRGDTPDCAKTQIKIMQDVLGISTAKKLVMCPTYYSFDPVLEKVFGDRPKNYWEDLGNGLPKEVDLFWTGPKVCSSDYPESHLQEVEKKLKRKPFLWDNYPVNDGAKLSKYLHLDAFENRPPYLANHSSGHAVNPMNQPYLSQIPLQTLPQSYQQRDYNVESAIKNSLSLLKNQKLADQIKQDLKLFQECGLDQLGEKEKDRMIQSYQTFDDHFAYEIVAWLKGEYKFDPECLTD